MKKDFFDYIIKILEQEPNVYLLLGDLGYPRYDELKARYPHRVFNCGASEQTMMDMAVGLAYSGKIPFTYTITPFYLRAFETIRTYLNHENLHVIMMGAGRDDDYSKHDGYSHDAKDISEILGTQKNVDQWYPKDKKELKKSINQALIIVGPHFISLTR